MKYVNNIETFSTIMKVRIWKSNKDLQLHTFVHSAEDLLWEAVMGNFVYGQGKRIM